jgi:hypothetical protein
MIFEIQEGCVVKEYVYTGREIILSNHQRKGIRKWEDYLDEERYTYESNPIDGLEEILESVKQFRRETFEYISIAYQMAEQLPGYQHMLDNFLIWEALHYSFGDLDGSLEIELKAKNDQLLDYVWWSSPTKNGYLYMIGIRC